MISEEMLRGLGQACALLHGPPLQVVDAGRRFGAVDAAAAANSLALARPRDSDWAEVQVVGDAMGAAAELEFALPEGGEIPLGELVLAFGEPVSEEGGFDMRGRVVEFAPPQIRECEIVARLRRDPHHDGWVAVSLAVTRVRARN